MRTYNHKYIAGESPPTWIARMARHHIYDIPALVAEGIERFGSGCPSPKHRFYANAQAFYLQDGTSAGSRGIVHDAGGVLIRLDPTTLERR